MIDDIDDLIDYGLADAPPRDRIPILPDICDWAEEHFYVVETKRPIVLQPIQKVVLREFFRQREDGRFVYRTGLYSTIKKSGKTTIAAVAMLWAAECWGEYLELFHLGNKLGQAQDRAFKIAKHAIELSPRRKDWVITATKMIHLPTHNFIQALPVNAAGEAGSNQCFTAFTELHGYVNEEDERFYSEMQPVPTQPLSFRFLESYAGYEGESNLLKMVWDAALEGQRVHDEYPIYAAEGGLIGYIDTGVEARRMPWQTPEYYVSAEKEELPHEYRRIHLNEWAGGQARLFNIALWDRLKGIDNIPIADDFIVAVDAAVSGDCMAAVVTGYNWEKQIVVEVETMIWPPPAGGVLDYDETIVPYLKELFRRRRIREVAYDPHQLHATMTTLSKLYKPTPFYSFDQKGERLDADTALLTRVQQGKLAHTGNQELHEHIENADSKPSGEKAIRIVKRHAKKPIDGAVAMSMSAHRWESAKRPKPPRKQGRQRRTNFWGGGR